MKSVFFLIASDPRTSGRPAEAVRIAAGLSAWKKIAVSIYFAASAVPLLQMGPDRVVDQETVDQCLAILTESGSAFYAPETVSGAVATSLRPISASALAARMAEADHVLRF